MNENRGQWGNNNRTLSTGSPRPWESGSHNFGGLPPSSPPSPLGKGPLRRLLRQNSNCVCLALTLVFLASPIFIFVMQQLYLLFPGFALFIFDLSPVGLGFINMSMFALALFLPALLIMHFLNMPLRVAFPMRRVPAGLTVSGVFCTLGMSVVGVYIAAILTATIAATTGTTPSMPDFSPPAYGVGATIVFLVSLSVFPAVFEELLFRGAIMQSLRRFGDPFALAVSSILFAMLHRNFIQGPNALLAGLVLGYFTLRTGSLIPAMVAHFVNNFLSGSLSVIMVHLPERHAQILNFSIIPTYLALGALGFIIMSMYSGGFIPLRQSLTGLSERHKYLLFFTSPLALVFIAATIWETRQFVG